MVGLFLSKIPAQTGIHPSERTSGRLSKLRYGSQFSLGSAGDGILTISGSRSFMRKTGRAVEETLITRNSYPGRVSGPGSRTGRFSRQKRRPIAANAIGTSNQKNPRPIHAKAGSPKMPTSAAETRIESSNAIGSESTPATAIFQNGILSFNIKNGRRSARPVFLKYPGSCGASGSGMDASACEALWLRSDGSAHA